MNGDEDSPTYLTASAVFTILVRPELCIPSRVISRPSGRELLVLFHNQAYATKQINRWTTSYTLLYSSSLSRDLLGYVGIASILYLRNQADHVTNCWNIIVYS